MGWKKCALQVRFLPPKIQIVLQVFFSFFGILDFNATFPDFLKSILRHFRLYNDRWQASASMQSILFSWDK